MANKKLTNTTKNKNGKNPRKIPVRHQEASFEREANVTPAIQHLKRAPSTLSAPDLANLQRTLGNQTLHGLIEGKTILGPQTHQDKSSSAGTALNGQQTI